ncbi:MAG: alpha/beta fold hydrolase, partial [Oscillospiraceae bacterium]|nr:alpha/beta fold hydrolase [Oscillospiraceae bacterium]
MFNQIISTILALWLGIGGLPGLAGQAKHAEPRDCCPIVFVHGLGGCGEEAGVSLVFPPWGMLAGSMQKALNRKGYEAHAVSMGQVSSTWDRACELYANLTGTRVDYGEAHAKAHGHRRYGETYRKALVKDWSAERPVALLGHSFGGSTANLFAQLCEEGSAAEMAAGQVGISPLFTGELKGRVLAVVTLAGVLNGTTAAEPYIAEEGGMGATLPGQMMMMARAGAILPIIEWLYPFYLGQFGISARDFYRHPLRTWKAGDTFLEQKDSAAYDLTVDGAKELNEGIRCQPNIYYFSYAAQATEPDAAGNQVPKDFMWSMFLETSVSMGKKREPFTTPGGVLIDDSWLPNDGLVNVVSARYPLNAPHKD